MMKIKAFIDHIYWVSKVGRPKRKISPETLFANPELIENPIFFLSTGRCGTEWFTHLVKRDKRTAVFHDPVPSLSVQNKFIHQLFTEKDKKATETATQILFAGREPYLRYAYKAERRYVETNNHITFFAHALTELFPSAKFVHLYRHPGDFVTSGLNRGWFGANSDATEKIIVPADKSEWKEYSEIEKIAWVWNETNAFIENFKMKYKNQVYAYDFTKRNPEEIERLIDFLDLSIPSDFVHKSLRIKRNVQKEHQFPPYKSWSEKDKNKLKVICGELSSKYQYEL